MNSAALHDLSARIEVYLLTRPVWVPVEILCRDCEVSERLLRADGRRRPIYSRFAISSSTKGLKHIRHTTVEERLAYKHARRKVLVANARALREFQFAVADSITGKPARELFTGQGVFF